MANQSPRQKQTVARVMHEFKTGELASGEGGKAGRVKSPRQAIAIALSEAGASRTQTPAEKRHARARTESGEDAAPKDEGGTRGQAKAKSGKAPRAPAAPQRAAKAEPAAEPTHAQLMKQARQAAIPGRSRMTKEQLKRALRRH